MNQSSRRRLAALAALLLVAAVTLAAGCGGNSGGKGGGGGGTLVDGTTDSVTNVDPAGNYDYGSATLDAPIFQHLLEAGPGGIKPHPVLAKDCEFQGDLKTYGCDLRTDVKFHNGQKMTAADVVASFNRVNKIKDESGIYTLLSNLDSVEATGQYAVTFHLKAPQATWPLILTTGAAQIVPKTYPADKLVSNTSPQYGTGPYMLTKFTPGQQAVLERFKDYWGDAPKSDRLIIRYYTKSSTMKLALENKNIDMAFQSFTPTELGSLQNDSGLVVHKGKGSSIRYLVLNVTRPPTDKLAVRQAIAYMMPRASIASRVYRGTVVPLYSQVPAGLPGHVDAFATQYGKSPDATKAKSMLQTAGISTPVNLTLWYTPTHYGDASADEFAEIKRALETDGVFKVTLQSAEWATYSDALGKTYGAFQLGWFPDYVDGENYLLPFFDSNSNFTENNYKNPAMDSLLKKEQGTKDESAREDLIKQAQMLSAKDVPIIPYWQGAMVAVSRDNVNGIDETLDPTFIMRFWLISKS